MPQFSVFIERTERYQYEVEAATATAARGIAEQEYLHQFMEGDAYPDATASETLSEQITGIVPSEEPK